MRITILGEPQNYKNFAFLIQNFGNIFQAMIYNQEANTFHQFYNEVANNAGKKHNKESIKKVYKFMLDQVIATCEMIINRDTPDKVLKANEGAAEIVRILENVEKVNQEVEKQAEQNKTDAAPQANP